MKRNIAIALASASLTAFSAHADVQSSFPDGYVIVETGEEVRTPGFSHAELVGSFPQPSFVDYIARTGEAANGITLVALEKRGD